MHDCGIGLISPDLDYSTLLTVMKRNPPIRYSGFLTSSHWKKWTEEKKLKPERKDPRLRILGMKAWVDGSTQGGSAYFR